MQSFTLNRILLIAGCWISLQPVALAIDEPQQTETVIPLDKVLTYEMPVGRNVNSISDSAHSIAELIQQSLRRKRGELAGAAFIVQGDETDALRRLQQILASHQKPKNSVDANKRNWIVFFSRDSGEYVYLDNVSRKGNKISVRYRFVTHDSKELTRHFALIPIGNMEAGRYRVTFEPVENEKPTDQSDPSVRADRIREIVCQPFDFSVE